MDPASISARLQHWAIEKPNTPALIFLSDGQDEAGRLTYGELHDRAAACAGELLVRGAQGRPVLLLYPPGLEFVTALMGCFYAGAIAVPVPFQARNQSYERIRLIIENATPAVVLTVAASAETAGIIAGATPCLATDTGLEGDAEPVRLAGSDAAVLQYTSGSTGNPKGVVVTHGAVTANLEMLRSGFQVDQTSRYVNWLPLFHDMGLFGNLLIALYCGALGVLMPPLSFLQRPQRWLDAIGRYGATISGGPNFAYDLCVRRFARMSIDGLDLSTWQIAFCGSERVRLGTMQSFARLFEPFGFKASALFPCYGLAEATLFVSGGPKGFGVRTVEAGASPGGAVVSCGVLGSNQTVMVVDPQTRLAVADGAPGEIWISGDHIASGYWNDPGKTVEAFDATLPDEPGKFLKTGDIGFVRDGELYVTGRTRDMLIIRGTNIDPDDVEVTVAASSPGFSGVAAAFSIDVDDVEQIVVVQEVERVHLQTLAPQAAIADALAAVAEQHGFRLYDLVLAYPGAIPKTTSGKVQRQRCRAAYLAGALRTVAPKVEHRSLGRNQSAPTIV